MRRVVLWVCVVVVVAVVAVGGALWIHSSSAPAAGTTGVGSAPSASASPRSSDDGRTGGTTDQHSAKPGENK